MDQQPQNKTPREIKDAMRKQIDALVLETFDRAQEMIKQGVSDQLSYRLAMGWTLETMIVTSAHYTALAVAAAKANPDEL